MLRSTWARCPVVIACGPDDGDGSPTGSAPTPETPPEGTSAAGQVPAPEKGKTFDEEYVVKLRQENASRRAREKELEAQLKAHEDAKLSDEQKRAKELQEVRDELNHLRHKARMGEVIDAAVRAGASKPAAVAKLVDDGDDDLDAAIAKLKKELPELFRPAVTGSADGGSKGKVGTEKGMSELLRDAFGRTTVG